MIILETCSRLKPSSSRSAIAWCQTAALFRARDKSRRTPVIFLSALNKRATDFAEGYAQGAVDYLVKPFEPAILRAKVEVFVELYRGRDEIRRQAEALIQQEREQETLRRRVAQSQFARESAEASALIHRTVAESIPQQVWTADSNGADELRQIERGRPCAIIVDLNTKDAPADVARVLQKPIAVADLLEFVGRHCRAVE